MLFLENNNELRRFLAKICTFCQLYLLVLRTKPHPRPLDIASPPMGEGSGMLSSDGMLFILVFRNYIKKEKSHFQCLEVGFFAKSVEGIISPCSPRSSLRLLPRSSPRWWQLQPLRCLAQWPRWHSRPPSAPRWSLLSWFSAPRWWTSCMR